ncbi:MAG: hypothetical protein U0V87_18565 [Acidobacteriota bacterium]
MKIGTTVATLARVRGVMLSALVMVFVLSASSAFAAKHFMVIQEVFVGPPADGLNPSLTPDQRAQYVMLRMTAQGQTLVSGTVIRVEDKDGNILGNFGQLTANVTAGGGVGCAYPACPAIIIGTQAAKNLFSFAFDRIVDGEVGRVALPAAGGRACFKDATGGQLYDCVAWGNFSCTVANCPGGANALHSGDTNAPPIGNGCDGNFGTPAAASTGMKFGKTVTRGTFNCAAKENSTNFALAFPKPVNNAGTNDNTDSDADGLINRLDCNTASAALLWKPVEVSAQTVTGKPTSTDSWASQNEMSGTGITYDEIRGSLSAINGFTDDTCHSANGATTSATDSSTPPLGDGFYYVVRADGGGSCVGTYGNLSTGTSRDTSLTSCP